VTRDLKVTRVFSTLVEEMKAIGIAAANGGGGGEECTDVMAPVAHSERSPVLLLMGGGMGAGKSTVLKEIKREALWMNADAVVVEADAFKETDVIYRAISSMGHHNDMLQTAELVRTRTPLSLSLSLSLSVVVFLRFRSHAFRSACCAARFRISIGYRESVVRIANIYYYIYASSSRELIVD
jgi:hypothetical protein